MSIIVQLVFWNMGYNLQSVLIYQEASAHFYGVPVLQNKTAGDYKIVFQPYPTIPIAGDNSTKINLSILGKDDRNINAVFASLIIKSKDTGEILKRFPYGFYEFSDMTFSYTFPNVGTYLLTLESKINGDPSYSQNPLLVDFELPVGGGKYSLTFAQSLAFYLIVAIAVIAAITFYVRTRRK
ncbi:MAG TPA: hypothetical protein VH481_03965 [Nitrososphaeraceae archaeon]